MTEKTAFDLLAERVRHLETLEVTMAYIYGWDGSAWLRQFSMWSAPVRYALDETGTAIGAGNALATITLDIEGYVFMLQGLHYWHDAGGNNRCDGWATTTGVNMWLFDEAAVTTNYYQALSVPLLMADGDIINARAVAPGAGKVMMLSIWGYLMPIAE